MSPPGAQSATSNNRGCFATTSTSPAALDWPAPDHLFAAVTPEIAKSGRLIASGDTLALITEAANEIARFDTELGAELAPFGSILLRSESAASSKIENLSATAQAIFLAELGDPSRRNASIIVANTTAMQAALRLAERIDAHAILAMHKALLSASEPQLAGRWRTRRSDQWRRRLTTQCCFRRTAPHSCRGRNR